MSTLGSSQSTKLFQVGKNAHLDFINGGHWRRCFYACFTIFIFWLKDESLDASDSLPDPEIIAQEIVEDLEAALERFRKIVGDLTDQRTAS